MLLADELWPTHVALAALYLRGAPRPIDPARRRWPLVERAARHSACDLGDLGRRLRDADLTEEATVLAVPGLLSWAEARASRVLTPVCRGYPALWRQRLGDAAPAALWKRGAVEDVPLVGVVGSRQVGAAEAAFAEAVGTEAVRGGFGLVSGGAAGCDSFGARGASAAGGPVLRLLPCGLDRSRDEGAGDLALAAPGEPFSSALAMERNALIYAAAEGTVVVHARFRQGGTWHGAADALRRHLAPILVREAPDDRAYRALVALGARPLPAPESLFTALRAPALQPEMFGTGRG
ncbi:MAG: DNA-processing protein DprA [Fimbriimonas sp.]